MTDIASQLQVRLDKRVQNNSLRVLKDSGEDIDFSSNDYLGLARNSDLHNTILAEFTKLDFGHGSTGSRLISGNHNYFQETEHFLRTFHKGEAALIFNSGYDANIGFFSTVPQRGDTIFYDELIHASIRDGIRLSHAKGFSFGHNNMDNLKDQLQRTKGNSFIAVESIYSMDGDEAPLKLLAELAGKYNSNLIVDEAHSTGISGEKGEGLTCELGLESHVFARLHTFGKAMGCHGGVWIISKPTRDILINYCRSFIFTTALPPFSICSIMQSYQYLMNHPQLKQSLYENIHYFTEQINTMGIPGLLKSHSPIQSIIIPGNSPVKSAAGKLQLNGFQVVPILHPTVPEGSERIRLSIHSFNTNAEMDQLILALKMALQKIH